MQNPVIITGAGPGGLTLALALHQRNIPVLVFEAVPALKPLGVGINLLPHSVRVLHGLGLQEGLAALAIQTAELRYVNKFGQLIWAEPRGLLAGYPYPQYSIHRGELQMFLYTTACERLGAAAIQTGLALEDWADEVSSIRVTLRASDGARQTVTGRCLVAADGIHSAARRKLYPAEGPPLYSGRILWRATSEAEPFLGGRTMIMAGHQNQKFVCYPISKAHAEAGCSLINWIAELNVPDWTPPQQDWNRAVTKARFADQFAQWRFDWLNIPQLIDSAPAIYEYPMVDRDPLPRWTHGRMTLLGDAAHPMYPIGSNGASQAILDAELLAAELATQDEVEEALATYEATRRPATGKIVLMNRQNGPEQVMQMAEERAPQGFTHIHEVIAQAELEAIAARYKQAAGFSIDQVRQATADRARSSQATSAT
ncbi:MAG: flavin-dependent oxidoreductase [Caldilineaceae bacterium]